MPLRQREKECNHLTDKSMTILRQIEQRITLLEDDVSFGIDATWETEANRLRDALLLVKRQAEVVQHEKQRLLMRLRMLCSMRAASLDPVHVECSPVEYNIGETRTIHWLGSIS